MLMRAGKRAAVLLLSCMAFFSVQVRTCNAENILHEESELVIPVQGSFVFREALPEDNSDEESETEYVYVASMGEPEKFVSVLDTSGSSKAAKTGDYARTAIYVIGVLAAGVILYVLREDGRTKTETAE